MKKTIFAIAALALLFTGCTKEFNQTYAPGDVVTVRAQVNDTYTKVAADNAGTFSWQAGDKITILNDSGTPYEFTTSTGMSDAPFTCTTFEGSLSTEAFYPASANHESGKFYLEPEFAWKDGETNMPMIGVVNTGTKAVSFKTTGAAIKLVCYNVADEARKLVVSSDTKKLSGQFTPSGDPLAIATADKGASDNTITITFAAGHPTNMVFYVPVPTGDLGKLSFVMKDGSDADVSNVQETKGSIEMTRAHIVAAPALNCGETYPDALLTNAEIVAKASADSWSSYKSGSITNTYGTWSYNAAYQGNYGGSGNYYMQLRNNSTVSYLQLPAFTNEIESIILHSVCNSSEDKYTGSIYFRENADNEETPIATAPTATKAKEDITMVIPAGYTTGYVMVSGACRIAAFTVKFRSDAMASPTITPASDNITIAIASGDTNTASTTFTYTSPLDANPIVAAIIEGDNWLDSAEITGSGPFTLTVSASKNNTGVERSATVRLRGTGVYKDITVTQPNALVVNPSLTVVNGSASFSATWADVANVSNYLVYFGSTDNLEANPTSLTPLTPTYDGSSTWSVTQSGLTNGDTYYLYVKSSPAANYVAPASYSKWIVEPGGTTDFTYVFTSKSWAATLNDVAANWSSGGDGNGFTAGQGNQITTAKSGANATSPVSFTNVSKIVVTYNTNKSTGAGTIKVKVGSNTEKSNAVAYSGSENGTSSNFTTTFNFSPTESGNILLTTNVTTNSIWVKSITITATGTE